MEVLETVNDDGMSAQIIGGKKPVFIVAHAAYTVPERRGPSDGRLLPPKRIPQRYEIRSAGKSTWVYNYDRALAVALWHANRI